MSITITSTATTHFFTPRSKPTFSQDLPTVDCWYLSPGLPLRTLTVFRNHYAHRFVLFSFIIISISFLSRLEFVSFLIACTCIIISVSYRIVSKIVALCCSVKNRCTKPSKCLGKSSHLQYVKFVSIITVPDPVIGGHCVLLKCLLFYLSTFCCFGFLEIPAGSPSKGRFYKTIAISINVSFSQNEL